MYELRKEQFTLVLPWLEDIRNKAVYAFSVIELIQEGRVFVNHLDNPTACFITNSGGFYCLAGREDDALFNQAVICYMNNSVHHNGFFALGVFTDAWEFEISKYTIHHSIRISRSYFSFNRDKFLHTYPDTDMPLNKDYDYIPLNEQISKEYREHFYPYYKLAWSSNAQFCDFGVGHFLKYKQDLVSVCTSPYIGGGFAEIDIITIECFKRRGLATWMGIEFIKDCLHKQLTPNWCCHSDNVESNHLAVKLCFDKIDESPMYWYHNES
ncbi:GNAT family N-acetyltransferase [Paenibacillus tundrae]|uniref:GNAT family N-acetyltransferase n=1 Tax=Paenibacillus tundrae TaxID=528187 RepID=UPI0030CEBA99